MTEAVFELDINGIITYVNQSARTLLDKQEWELIGQTFSSEFSEKNSTRIDKTLTGILDTAGTSAAELGLQQPGSRAFTVIQKRNPG